MYIFLVLQGYGEQHGQMGDRGSNTNKLSSGDHSVPRDDERNASVSCTNWLAEDQRAHTCELLRFEALIRHGSCTLMSEQPLG